MARYLLLCLLACAVCLNGFSQTLDEAGLRTAIDNAQPTKTKVDLILQLGDLIHATQPKEGVKLGNEALDLAELLRYGVGQMKAHHLIGRANLRQGRYNRSTKALEEALALAQTLGQETMVVQLYKELSLTYEQAGKPTKAAPYKQQYMAARRKEAQARTSQQIANLEDAVGQQRDLLLSQQLQTERAKRENEEILAEVQKREMELIQKDLLVSRMAQDSIELELEKTTLLQDKLKTDLALERAQRTRNWLFIGGGMLLLLALGAWQRLRFLQTRKQARLEQERVRQLEIVDHLKDQFLANTSHELKTPLNGIIGLAEAMHEKLGEDSKEEQQETLAMIVSSGRRLSSLVNDLLDFSQIKNDTIELKPKPVDLRSMVDVVCRINQSMVGAKPLTVLNNIPVDGLAVAADENRLQQILHNLVGNAIKFTHAGEVQIDAQPKNGMMEVCVSDTGIGIPREKHEAIFEAFVQADGSIQREFSGTGLGLSISRKLIELHGGKLWVESQEGKGSRFFFTLPLSAEKAHPVQNTAMLVKPLVSRSLSAPDEPGKLTPKLNGNGQQTFRILVVDDEIINHQVLKKHLSDSLYEIVLASNGSQALEIISGPHRFDLVLLDIMMPQMSGYEVCQKIRETYLASELPVIMVTAKNQVEDLVTGLASGANDYISKPFTRDELLARVKTHLNLLHIHDATKKFVPVEFLESLGYDSITEVQLGDLSSREVTVFFSDIRAYTSLSEGMSPEDNFRFVNAYAGRMGPIIRKYGGFVNQYLGDGIMAIFQKGPEKAIRAAIEMQESVKRYNAERIAANRAPIKVGMGLHSGPLVMGIIGDKERRDAATISDTVNTAARMEGLTKFYGANILVSESTLSGLSDPTRFHYRYLGRVQVKGKKQAIGVYEFFGGEDQANQTLKWGVQQDFEQGLRHYFAREFPEAIRSFELVLSINQDDRAATHYLQRAVDFSQSGVPENWDGVETMSFK
ncbi:MAG: ATP-binding protein [Bacteroidota bacterium]